jgi:cobalt-zinc-cadmium efflux system membrane fusion protein
MLGARTDLNYALVIWRISFCKVGQLDFIVQAVEPFVSYLDRTAWGAGSTLLSRATGIRLMPPAHCVRVHIIALSLLLVAGCEEERAREATPTVVARGVVRLTAKQQSKLGLSVQPVGRREVAPERDLVGWVILRPACELVVKAPVSGFVELPAGRSDLTLGAAVRSGEALGVVRVLLSPQEEAQLVAVREECDTAIRQSELSMRLAKTQLERLETIKNVVAGTRLDELHDAYEKSKAALEESKQKLPFLPIERAESGNGLRPVNVAAPFAGTVTAAMVRPRQFVLQGEPLWTLEDRSTVWVRVPVFDADLPKIDHAEAVQLRVSGAKNSLVARPVSLPLASQPGERFVDLTYEVENADVTLRPGQRVEASVPLMGQARETVVPVSAILLDGQDNVWVYVQTEPEQFHRQKVELGCYLPGNGGVVVRRGLTEGQAIVIVGVQSVYGEEFKTDIQVEEGESEEEEERERERKRG